MELVLNKGFVSDYDAFMLWVNTLTYDAEGYYLDKEPDGSIRYAQPCRIKKVAQLKDFDTETAYAATTEDMLNEGFDVTAEFVTDSGCSYVGVEFYDDKFPIENFFLDNVNYC